MLKDAKFAFRLFFGMMLILSALFFAGRVNAGGGLEGIWYGDDRVLEIWWCPESQALKFEIRTSDMSSLIASGTVEESARPSGSVYVFVTEDSRILQADYDGRCNITIGQLGSFRKAECEEESYGGTSFDPCATTGTAWENLDQPGMYLYFYEYYGDCKYELFALDQLVERMVGFLRETRRGKRG